jgi:ABC-2 type transport system permease protein
MQGPSTLLDREVMQADIPAVPGPLLRAVPAPAARARRWLAAWAALCGANARELLREPLTLFWILGFPLLFVLLFGTVFRGSGGVELRVGVAVAEGGAVARELAGQFAAVPGVTVREGTPDALLAAMRRGDLDGVVTLPRELDAALQGGPASLTLTYDPGHPSQAGLLQSLTAQAAERVDRRLTGRQQLLSVQATPLNGRVLGGLDYVLPGILAMALLQLGLFGTALPLIQLRQSGVLRHLSATPLRRDVLSASQITLRLAIALATVALLVGLSRAAFGVAMVGNWLTLLLVVALGGLAMIALGYLLAARSRTVESGNGLVTAVFFPMMFLSGIFVPLESGPAWLKSAASLVPTTYLGDALRQVMVDATPQFSLGTDLVVLAGCLAVVSVAAVRLFRWE